jgi:hypothetical protein
MGLVDICVPTASPRNATRATVLTAVVVAALHVALAIVAGRLVVLPGLLSLDLAEGLTLPATLLVGPPGALGSAVGYVLADGLSGPVGVLTVVGGLGHVVLGLVGYELWRRLSGVIPCVTTVRSLAAFVGVALFASVAATAFVGWGYVVSGAFPFYVSTVLELPGLFVATVAVGLPFHGIASRLREPGTRLAGPAPPATATAPVLFVCLVVGWYLSGTVLSIGYELFDVVSERAFRSYGVEFLLGFESNPVLGEDGSNAQAVVGSTVVLALFVLGYRSRNWGVET